jgi:hypothetical protein
MIDIIPCYERNREANMIRTRGVFYDTEGNLLQLYAPPR